MGSIPIKYITNEQGESTDVLIPLNYWKEIEKELQGRMAEGKLRKRVKEMFTELGRIKNGETKARPLNQFLDEL
jgi:hypothetical protein